MQLRDSSSKLSLLKKIVEIQEPLGVEYRCVQCRNCSQCKDADKTEKISIREEAEMYAIKQSIFLNYDEKRIDCSLPLRGPEREFMSTNRNQAVAILNKQCKQYFGDSEVKESINKAFKKLMDRGFIKLIEDLTDEQKAQFEHKEVVHRGSGRGEEGHNACEVLVADAVGVLLGHQKLEGVLAGLPLVEEELLELLDLLRREGVVDNSKEEVHDEVEVDHEVGKEEEE